jgi:hypothetical protein
VKPNSGSSARAELAASIVNVMNKSRNFFSAIQFLLAL